MSITEIKHVCPPDHKHELTDTCHAHHRCRCDDCVSAHSAYQRDLRKRKAYGRYTPPARVPAEPVREHLRMLKHFGLGTDRVADLAGVSRITVRRLMGGRTGRDDSRGHLPARISTERARKLLAVPPDVSLAVDNAFVSSRGVQRRIQALAVRGWSQLEVSRRLDMNQSNANKMLAADHVMAKTHRRVAAIFDELWDKEPPQDTPTQRYAVKRVAAHAARKGWLPALAWDDIDLDDAPAFLERGNDTVDDTAVELAITGSRVDLTPAERRTAVQTLHGHGLTDIDIAKRLDCADRTVLRIRQELDLPPNESLHHPQPARRAA